MISVERTAIPAVLQQHGNEWLTSLKSAIDELTQIQKNPHASQEEIRRAKQRIQKAQGRYAHRQVKDSLVIMFRGKCAYCESPIRVVSYGHIEHFYPKSKPEYIDRTFDWNNLLLSCEICNNAGHKGTSFPLDSSGDPLLIDPTDGVTDPTEHLKFVWDPDLRLATVHGIDQRGQKVEHVFDLNGVNGRKELLRERSRYFQTLYTLYLLYVKHRSLEALCLLEEACRSDAPYLAFALAYIEPNIM